MLQAHFLDRYHTNKIYRSTVEILLDLELVIFADE